MKNDYVIHGDTVLITLNRRKGVTETTSVSTESLGKLLAFDAKWRVHSSGTKLYATTNIVKDGKKTTLKLHRFIADCTDGMVVDHINGDTLDNSMRNLRVCKQFENGQNRSALNKNNTSGIRGVTWSKQKNKWAVSVMLNRKRKHVGLFSDLEEASQASKDARIKYFTHANKEDE